MKEVLGRILNAPLVIEEGASNGWTYRKWSSGVSECWGVFAVTSKTYSANGGQVYNPPFMPSGLFTNTSTMAISAIGRITGAGNSSAGFISANNTTQIQVWIINHSAAAVTNTGTVMVHIRGRWK